MIRFLLDTDHASLQERGPEPLRARLAAVPPESIAVSPITVEEMLRGRLAMLARRSDSDARVRAYAKLMETVRFFAAVPVVPYDHACEERFPALRAQRLRLGILDMLIAAAALAHNLTLLTRNQRDFACVPGLVLEDWTV